MERENTVRAKATTSSATLTTRHEWWRWNLRSLQNACSANVNDYISFIYQYVETTGKRLNFENIAEKLTTKRHDDGKPQ